MSNQGNSYPPSPESSATPPSSGRQVAKATGIVSLFTLLSRVLGLIRDVVIASQFGAGMASDAFFAAFKVPNLLRRLVAEGSLATAFVPIFTEEHSKSDEAGRKAIGAVTAFSLLLSSTLVILGLYFSEEITLLLAPGFGVGTEKTVLATSLLRIMLPYTIIVSIIALSASILNSLGKFALPAMWPVDLNIGMIAIVLVFSPFVSDPIYVLAWSVVIGGALALVPLLYQLYKMGFSLHLRSPFRSAPVRILSRMMLPSVLSSSLYQVMIFINTLLASLLVEGSVTWLYYADRLFQFPLGVFTAAVATAILPTLSKLSAKNDHIAIEQQIRQALSWMTIITIPATVGLCVLAEPIVIAIYEYGAFGRTDSQQTAHALVAFSVGLWSVSCQSILVRAFLAKKNTLLPSIVTSLSIGINIVFAFMLMGPPVANLDTPLARYCSLLIGHLHVAVLGHAGLALAGSCGSFVAMVLLIGLLPRVGITLALGPLFQCVTKTLIASAVMAVVLFATKYLQFPHIVTIIIAVPLGIFVFYCGALLIGLSEVRQGVALVTSSLERRFKGKHREPPH